MRWALPVLSALLFWHLRCGAAETPPLAVVELQGDQVISTPVIWADRHYRIHGNLVLTEGGELDARNCRIELMCTYARQYRFAWEKGGILRTSGCTVGGSGHRGTASTLFDLQEGWWHAEQTTIEFSTGIQFGWDTDAHLHARDLRRGQQPDSVIVTGRADVVLADTTFAIALSASGSAGGETTLDLPRNTPLTRTFDGSVLPGARYRLELRNVTVPEWYLFFGDVRNEGPRTTYRLNDCPWVLPSLMGRDLTGSVCLPTNWTGTQPPGTWRSAVPAGTRVTCGTLTVEAVSDRVGIPAWGVYLSGPASDLTLSGPTRIAELMVNDGGKCRLAGTTGTHDAWCTATTIEVHGTPAQTAELHCTNASLGWFSDLWGVKGQITAHDNATVTIDGPYCDDVILITKGTGTIAVQAPTGKTEFQVLREGGPVLVDGQAPVPLLDEPLRSQLLGYHADLCEWVMALDVGSGMLKGTKDTAWSIFINGNLARVLMAGARLHAQPAYAEEALRWCDTFVRQQQRVETSTGAEGGYWGDHGPTGNLYLADSGTAATALAVACRRGEGERRVAYLAALQRFAAFVHSGCRVDPQNQKRQASTGWVLRDGKDRGALGCGYYNGHLSTAPYTIATAVNGGAFMSTLYALTGEAQYRDTAVGAVRWLLANRLPDGQLPYLLDGTRSTEWPLDTITYGTEALVAVPTHVNDPALEAEIGRGITPIVEWLLQKQNPDGPWGVARSQDQQRSPGVVTLLAWYYRNVVPEPRVAKAIRAYCLYLLDPANSAAYGVKDLVRTTGFVGLTVAELLEPGTTF
jgi:hypothetical protein